MAESIQQAVSDLSTKVAETLGVSGQQTGQEKTRGGVETAAQGGELGCLSTSQFICSLTLMIRNLQLTFRAHLRR
jgi:hypothetical protein